MGKSVELKKIPKNPLLFGIFITKLHKKWAILALSSVFVATALDRTAVIILKNLTDSITVVPLQMPIVWFLAALYPTLGFIASNVWRASGFSGMYWFTNLYSSGYQLLYEYLTLHSKDYFNSRFAGSLTNKITNAVDGATNVFEKALWNLIPTVLSVGWYIVFSWISNPLLGIIMIVWSVLFFLVNIWFAKILRPYSYESAESASVLKGRTVDSLSNITLVQEYAHLAGEREYIKGFIEKSKKSGRKAWSRSEWILTINGFFVFIYMAPMILTSLYLFQNHIVTLGVVVMTIVIVSELSGELKFLGAQLNDTAKYYGQAQEGLEEILKEHLIIDAPHAVDFAFSNGDITIERINFEYETTKVFRNLSLHIPSGQKVGLVGRSGAGKTTFVSLLLRHFDVQGGTIKIDGKNIYDVTLESLRKAIAFVPQDTSLFHRTIRENINYSNPQALDAEVKNAAKLAHADAFINKMPKKYETLVGERGVKLSGGQRQRISIARAFLKNSPILILDEATSSLDSASEHAIQESLQKLMEGRTVIAIAHRLSTLKRMDRIVVVENGKIIEDGSPEILLKKQKGIFKEMWEHQIKGFIVDK